MIIFELIAEFVIEILFIDVIGGTISRVNNKILKIRGIETHTPDEIKFEKLKKRYEHKQIKVKSNHLNINKGAIGTVIELIDSKSAFVEFDNRKEFIEVPLKKILVKGSVKEYFL